jgi:hypothetical protein
VSSKLGRPSGRPNSRSSIVGHPGASPEKGEPVFSSSPRTPLLHNGVWGRWPIDADAPRKSHGRLRGTARTNPSTAFPPSFEKRRNGCRFSTAPTGRRRSVEERSLGLSLHSEPSAWLGDSTKARLHSTLFQPSGCPIDGVHLTALCSARSPLLLTRSHSASFRDPSTRASASLFNSSYASFCPRPFRGVPLFHPDRAVTWAPDFVHTPFNAVLIA